MSTAALLQQRRHPIKWIPTRIVILCLSTRITISTSRAETALWDIVIMAGKTPRPPVQMPGHMTAHRGSCQLRLRRHAQRRELAKCSLGRQTHAPRRQYVVQLLMSLGESVVPSAVVRSTEMSVRYTRRAPNVLDKLSLEISVGVTGLIGANGAGKSALMRVIAGNLDPIAGQARGQLSLIREPARTGTTA